MHRFVLEPLGEVSVKGRVKPVEAWRLVCPQTDAQPRPQTPLVGREPEVAAAARGPRRADAGRGQLLFLIGDAGIGKTRLLAELRSSPPAACTWLEGRCLSYGTELLYGPFIEMLRGWVGAEEGEAELSVRTKLRAKLGPLPASQLPDVLPYLARLLSLKLDGRRGAPRARSPPRSSPREIRARVPRLDREPRPPGAGRRRDRGHHWADPLDARAGRDLLELADRRRSCVATSRIDPPRRAGKLRVRVLTDYAHRADDLRSSR